MRRPAIKGPVRASRSAFIVSHSISYLSRGAEEALVQSLEVLSEGKLHSDGHGGRRYFGSTMFSVNLCELEKAWRGPLDDVTVGRLADLVAGSVRLPLRLTRIACAEAARRVPARPLGTVSIESHVRVLDRTLHIDIDLEVPVGVSSSARRGP
jgi:hypothetical protein